MTLHLLEAQLDGPLLFRNELFMCCTHSARAITTIQLDAAWALVQQSLQACC